MHFFNNYLAKDLFFVSQQISTKLTLDFNNSSLLFEFFLIFECYLLLPWNLCGNVRASVCVHVHSSRKFSTWFHRSAGLTNFPLLFPSSQVRNDSGTWPGCTTKRLSGRSSCSTWRGAPRSKRCPSGSTTWIVRWNWLTATPSRRCCSPINATRRKRVPTTQP